FPFMVFLLVSPLPPRPTLFPYTTLFRSQSSIVFSGTVSQLGATSFADVPRSAQTIVVRVDSVLKKPAPVSLTRGDNVTVEVKDTDRKSTRLNSSHVANSYAVFCLKK